MSISFGKVFKNKWFLLYNARIVLTRTITNYFVLKRSYIVEEHPFVINRGQVSCISRKKWYLHEKFTFPFDCVRVKGLVQKKSCCLILPRASWHTRARFFEETPSAKSRYAMHTFRAQIKDIHQNINLYSMVEIFSKRKF